MREWDTMDKKKVCRIVIYTLLIIGILVIVLPIIIGAGHTYPCEDDFSFEMGGKTHSGLLGALKGAYGYYMTWQGTYLSNVIWYLVRPYDRGGMVGFRLVMLALSILLVVAIYVMVRALAKEQMSALALSLVTYLIAFNTSRMGLEKEFLYWYTGATNYALEFALACITLALTMRLKSEKDKKRGYILAAVGSAIGFLASGGSLEVTSFHCAWLLLMLIMCYEEIPKKKIVMLPFGASFVGALLNACAPGNFARSDATGGVDYGLTDAFKDTLACWRREWKVIFDNKFFVMLLVVAFIICLLCKTQIFSKGISTIKMLLLLPATFLIQYFTAFPVVFGYHSSELQYSRTFYTYELLAKLMLLFFVICFAQWWREHIKLSVLVPSGVALVMLVMIIANHNIVEPVKQGFSYNVAKELHEGRIQELCTFRWKVLSCLERCEKGTDVYLKVPGVPGSKVMYGMGLTAEPSVCNSHAATYYGFNSLIVEYSDEYEFPFE